MSLQLNSVPVRQPYEEFYGANTEQMPKLIEDKVHLIITPFCDEEACIELLKDDYNLKVRGIPLFQKNEKNIHECDDNHVITDSNIKCLICNDRPAKREVHLARQY